jgi:uncharacterized pyridoxamine 5'-phosphate oxidase family protein
MKKIIFPKKLNILGNKYKVKYRKILAYENTAVAGLCDSDNETIYISSNYSEKIKLKTLIHEHVHAIQEATGLDQVLNDNEREIWCQTMSTAFYQFAKDMKWIDS